MIDNAREALREITGEYTDALSLLGNSMPLVSPEPAVIETWTTTSLEQNLQILTQVSQRRMIIHAKNIFHAYFVAETNTQPEPTRRQVADHARLLHYHDGVTRPCRRDGSTEQNTFCLGCRRRKYSQTILSSSTRGQPYRLYPHLLGLLNSLQYLATVSTGYGHADPLFAIHQRSSL